MKATGIVRRIDDLGRVVVPKEIRKTLHIPMLFRVLIKVRVIHRLLTIQR